MLNKNETIKFNCIAFVFGIITTISLTAIYFIINNYFNLYLHPEYYIFVVPLIYGFLMQIIMTNLLSDTIVPPLYFEFGITFQILINFMIYFICPLSNHISYNELGYLFVIYFSPNIGLFFISWIYYNCESLSYKYYTVFHSQLNDFKSDIKYESKDKDFFENTENIIKKISEKVEENIKK